MNLRIDTSAASRMARDVSNLGRQATFAHIVALTRTAVECKAAEQEEMRGVFDRPTPFTLGAIYAKAATKADPTASVGIKDGSGVAARVVPPAKYLAAEIDAGARQLKSYERKLQALGVLPVGRFTVPGEAAKLDAYGNIQRSQVLQILAQARAQTLVGPVGPKGIAAQKRAVTRAGGNFFALPVGRGKLTAGVYLRRDSALGSATPRAVLIFTRAPRYRRRLDFLGVAQRTAETFYPAKLDEALAQYVGKAATP